jgi:hypothetical protein
MRLPWHAPEALGRPFGLALSQLLVFGDARR